MSESGEASPGARPAADSSAPATNDSSRFLLLIGADADFDAIVRAAKNTPPEQTERLLVLFGAEETFPFRPRPSTIMVEGMPPGVIASIPPLEEFGIASRLASTAGLPGCYDGSIVELAEAWLASLSPELKRDVSIHVAGAQTTRAAIVELGRRLNVPAHILHADGTLA